MQAADHKKLWQECLSVIRTQLPADVFNVWFSNAESISFENGKLLISVPSNYYVEEYENRLYKVFRPALQKVYGHDISIEYTYEIIKGDKDTTVTISEETPAEGSMSPAPTLIDGVVYEDIDPQLNDKYTFETYCLGASNRLPYSIAESISHNPKHTGFNPFFLYGNTGVGKTHLIQAIGQRIKQNRPSARVLYISARTFESQYGDAIRNKQTNDFVNFYQSMDVLLIDDIQELEGKPGIQNAFYPIFSYLHQKGTLLVMTSDRPPVDLKGMMDRLVNRFKWGVTEMLPGPDKELRKLILQRKSARNGLNLPDAVIDLIADHVTDSVRELEGIVVSLIARAALMNQAITPELASVVMQSTVKVHKRTINFDMIVEATAAEFDLDPDVIFSRSRVRDIADARQVIMYVAYKLTDHSSKMIGFKLSRSHVTVLHGIKTIENRMATEPAFSVRVTEIIKALNNE